MNKYLNNIHTNSVLSVEFLSDYTKSAGSLLLKNYISRNKEKTNENRSKL